MSKGKVTNSNTGIEVLTHSINNMDPDVGWWFSIGTCSTEEDEDFEHVFPSINKVFGTHKDAFDTFNLENFLIKKKGDKFVTSMKGYETLISMYMIVMMLKHQSAGLVGGQL